VGTTAIPQHLPRYHRFLRRWLDRTSELHREAKEEMDFMIGYDLLSKGSGKAAAATIDLFHQHYGFQSEGQMQDLKTNFAITCGGMRGLKDIVDALVHNATVKNELYVSWVRLYWRGIFAMEVGFSLFVCFVSFRLFVSFVCLFVCFVLFCSFLFFSLLLLLLLLFCCSVCEAPIHSAGQQLRHVVEYH
jgi:hypothetical protein